MKKFFLWAIAIVMGGCCVHSTAAHPGPSPTFAERLENQTIALTFTLEDGENVPFCSGVWISTNHILTANHCAEAAVYLMAGKDPGDESVDPTGVTINYIIRSDFDMTSPDEGPKKVRLGTVTAFDRLNDLALIRVDDKTKPKFIDYAPVVNTGRIADGTKVHVVGHTSGLWWTYSQGYVSNTWSNIPGPDPIKGMTLQISAPAWHGNSGGGAFDDDGNLIGIASWITKRGPQLSFFIHRDEILKFLKHHKAL